MRFRRRCILYCGIGKGSQRPRAAYGRNRFARYRTASRPRSGPHGSARVDHEYLADAKRAGTLEAGPTTLADGVGSVSWVVGRCRFDDWFENRICIGRPGHRTDGLRDDWFSERARSASTGSDGMVARNLRRRRNGARYGGNRRVCDTGCAVPAGATLQCLPDAATIVACCGVHGTCAT
jgi:hypothetical protein